MRTRVKTLEVPAAFTRRFTVKRKSIPGLTSPLYKGTYLRNVWELFYQGEHCCDVMFKHEVMGIVRACYIEEFCDKRKVTVEFVRKCCEFPQGISRADFRQKENPNWVPKYDS